MKVLALTRYGRLGASSRLRSMQFIASLKDAGIDAAIQPLFTDDMLMEKYATKKYASGAVLKAYVDRVKQLFRRSRFDLIWIEKEALPWTPAWWEKVLLSGVPYVLDYDDAIFHNYDLHSSFWVRHLFGKRIDALMSSSQLVIAGNDYLAQRARNAGAPWVEVLPTVIDLERYAFHSASKAKTSVASIVWVGSPSTVKYLAALEESLQILAANFKFKLRVIGGWLEMKGVDVECVSWTEESEVQMIAECDIGIMPLTDSPWERGKCGYKLIQYMACGLPVVASPIGVNTKIVQEGVNGFLAATTNGWVEKLGQLLGDAYLRKSMGDAGLQRVKAEYCVQQVGPRLASLLLKVGKKEKCVD